MAACSVRQFLHLIPRTLASLVVPQYPLLVLSLAQNLGMPQGCVFGSRLSSIYTKYTGDFIQSHSWWLWFLGTVLICPTAISNHVPKLNFVSPTNLLTLLTSLTQEPCTSLDFSLSIYPIRLENLLALILKYIQQSKIYHHLCSYHSKLSHHYFSSKWLGQLPTILPASSFDTPHAILTTSASMFVTSLPKTVYNL